MKNIAKKLIYCFLICSTTLAPSITVLCKNSSAIDANSVKRTAEQYIQKYGYKYTSQLDSQNAIKAINEITEFLNSISKEVDINLVKLKIQQKIYKIANKYDSDAVYGVINAIQPTLSATFSSVKDFINNIKRTLTNLLNEVLNQVVGTPISYDAQVEIAAKTAVEDTGAKAAANLVGYIYYAKNDANTDAKSTKWALLMHGYEMNGRMMANILAKYYLSCGINVLAVDMRSHGKSTGDIGLGWWESLDAWDWLSFLNTAEHPEIGVHKATQITTHGISLGSGTTLQLLSQAGFGRDLKKMNVVGSIDDCGYDSMRNILKAQLVSQTGMEFVSSLVKTITDKDDLYELLGEDNIDNFTATFFMGMKDANNDQYEIKQNSLHPSRKLSRIPLYIFHGTADTYVPYGISKNIVFPTFQMHGLTEESHFWTIDGAPHAGIVIGMNKAKYETYVYDFIDFTSEHAEETLEDKTKKETIGEVVDDLYDRCDMYECQDEEQSEKTILQSISNFFENILDSIGNFFENLFKGIFNLFR